MAILPIENSTRVQSPYLYLQAAGSDGDDQTVPGIHLRWDLRRDLGDNHLPKGNLAAPGGDFSWESGTQGFNKTDDFVKIYRTEFSNRFATIVDFSSRPDALLETGPVIKWFYNELQPVADVPTNLNTVELLFVDVAAYRDLRFNQNVNPNSDPQGFLRAYLGEIQIRVKGKLVFGYSWNVDRAGMQYETVSQLDALDVNTQYTSCRKQIADPSAAGQFQPCENVQYIRLKTNSSRLSRVFLYAYDDFILGINHQSSGGDWQFVGDFALDYHPTDNSVVFDRLEVPGGALAVEKVWPKFNKSHPNGAFKVNTDNYRRRWFNGSHNATNSIKYGVREYLKLSPQDTKARKVEKVLSAHELNDTAGVEVSYLDLLNFVAVDYHVARMLGLGHIDLNVSNEQFVYLAVYNTREGVTLDDGVVPGNDGWSHYSMSLPTKRTDYRLPPKPELEPVTYGLSVPSGPKGKRFITDENGYAPFADARFVNLFKKPFQHQLPVTHFWDTGNEYCLCEHSMPVLFGIEHRKANETSWRKPEILQNSDWKDLRGFPEVSPVGETGDLTAPLYTHRETEDGIHIYASYSINWFSRVSGNSNQISTDETLIGKRNTILPPSNFAVRLIQEEVPRIFTTPEEQTKLATLSGPDKTLVRTTFEWDHMHNQQYEFADCAEFFFREAKPLEVIGKIATVTDLPDNRVSVTTAPINVLTPTSRTLTPNIASANVNRFDSSRFTSGGEVYQVESISTAGANPTFILQKIKSTKIVDPLNSNNFISQEVFKGPAAGKRFMVREELDVASNWDSTLIKKVYLEPFYKVGKIKIEGWSTQYDGEYTPIRVVNNSNKNRTEIRVKNNFEYKGPKGTLSYTKRVRINSISGNIIEVSGNLTSELSIGDDLNILGHLGIDGSYSVASVSGGSTSTEIAVTPSIPNNQVQGGYIAYTCSHSINGIYAKFNEFRIPGLHANEITPPYNENELQPDGTSQLKIRGGLTDNAKITERLELDNSGNPIAGSRTGTFDIVLDNLALPPHIDPEVSWFRGTIRIPESTQFASGPTKMKALRIVSIDQDNQTLELVARDELFSVDGNYNPQNHYVPIATGNGIPVNVHPGYRVYLEADAASGNNFTEQVILPELDQGSKTTYMGIRALDTEDSLASYVPKYALLQAQELVPPLPPGEPKGPVFATRPDFYGKSTYTFDISVVRNATRSPYAVVFYRGTDRKILDALYKQSTVESILQSLASLSSPDADYNTDRWEGLVNVDLDSDGRFLSYTNGGFRFPVPDNGNYVIPNQNPSIVDKPFVSGNVPASGLVTLSNGQTVPWNEIIEEAINKSFLPLTEQQILYRYIKDGTQTSNRQPQVRDKNHRQIPFNSPSFDPFPMVRKHGNGTKVRFTDYTLDGASTAQYFYYGIEISNKFIRSERGKITPPIQMVHSAPPEPPVIKELLVQNEDYAIGNALQVAIKVNDFAAFENIRQIDVYRASSQAESLSVRSMTLAKSIVPSGNLSSNQIIDDFAGVSQIPYGDLYYRIVVAREIKNEAGQVQSIPSQPSAAFKTIIVDPNAPLAPPLVSENGNTTSGALQNVILKWEKTGYNYTYKLEQLNAQNTWKEVYRITSNDEELQYPPINTQSGTPDFSTHDVTANLSRQDADGNALYHTFRVQVENTAGRINAKDYPLTLAQGCADLHQLEGLVQFFDGNGTNQSFLHGGDIVRLNPNGTLRFISRVPSILPAGHNGVQEIIIRVTDSLGASHTKSISGTSAHVTFVHGDGGLDLRGDNLTYNIEVLLRTNSCQNHIRRYTLAYIAGPAYDLAQLTDILRFSDFHGSQLTPLTSGEVDDGTRAFPQAVTLTDISDVASIGQNLTHIRVTLTDNFGNADSFDLVPGGDHTFVHGDGGLVLDNQASNGRLLVEALVFTDLNPDGVAFLYELQYTFDPSLALSQLTNVVKYTDGHSNVLNPLAHHSFPATSNSFPLNITIEDLVSAVLPAGHNFIELEITVEDELGGLALKTINTAGGAVTFIHGDGNLSLDSSIPNQAYIVRASLSTSAWPQGFVFSYVIQY